jgi:hypothetical protein
LTYRPTRLHRLEEAIPWNGFLAPKTFTKTGSSKKRKKCAAKKVVEVLSCLILESGGIPWASDRFMPCCKKNKKNLKEELIYPNSLENNKYSWTIGTSYFF